MGASRHHRILVRSPAIPGSSHRRGAQGTRSDSTPVTGLPTLTSRTAPACLLFVAWFADIGAVATHFQELDIALEPHLVASVTLPILA